MVAAIARCPAPGVCRLRLPGPHDRHGRAPGVAGREPVPIV